MDMDERIAREKKRLRIALTEETQSLPDAYIAQSDRGIRESLLALDAWKQARVVFIYVSVGRESDTRDMIAFALAEGKTVAVPRCLKEGAMEARVIHSLNDLRDGRFGIPEPDVNAKLLPPDTLDLIVVPCIAADRQGYRLGHGGGYYDRYLAQAQCPTICLCRERLLQTALPHAKHDIPMGIVLTERECVR